MLILGQKGANLDQKGSKMGGTRFFPVLSLGYFINTPKIQFKYAKLGRSYDSFPRNLAKMSIFGLKRAFLDLNWPKTGQTGFFGQNPKMSLPLHWKAPTLCQILENSYEQILRSLTDIQM